MQYTTLDDIRQIIPTSPHVYWILHMKPPNIRVFIDNNNHIRNGYGVFIDDFRRYWTSVDSAMVEVAGIEPASEGLQRVKTTCVSDPLNFANATYEPAGAHARYSLSFGRNSGK